MAGERMHLLFNKDGKSSRTVRSPCHRPLPRFPPRIILDEEKPIKISFKWMIKPWEEEQRRQRQQARHHQQQERRLQLRHLSKTVKYCADSVAVEISDALRMYNKYVPPDGTEPSFSVPAAMTSSRFLPASSFTTRATFSPSASIPTELKRIM